MARAWRKNNRQILNLILKILLNFFKNKLRGHPHMTSQHNESYAVLYLFTGRSESLFEGVLGGGLGGCFGGVETG
jgi:hypothetical protein